MEAGPGVSAGPRCAVGDPGERNDALTSGRRCDSRSHRRRPNLDGSSCATSARRVEDQGPDPHPMSPSGERRLPDAVHPVLLFGSHRAVQRASMSPPTRSRRPLCGTCLLASCTCPQAIPSNCIDQPPAFSVARVGATMAGMPLPRNDSLVTYPQGALAGRSTVVHVTAHDDRFLVLTESTPCHPVDPRWPDQGPDRGTLTWPGPFGESSRR